MPKNQQIFALQLWYFWMEDCRMMPPTLKLIEL